MIITFLSMIEQANQSECPSSSDQEIAHSFYRCLIDIIFALFTFIFAITIKLSVIYFFNSQTSTKSQKAQGLGRRLN